MCGNPLPTGADAVLGAAMAMVIGLNVLLMARSERAWPLAAGAGILLCATAMLRRRNLAWAAAAGLVLFAATGAAVAQGAVSPGPLFGGGLAGMLVLGAAAVRTLAPRQAAVMGVAGTAVIAASETAGPDGLFDHRTVWALAGATLWSAALAVGLYLGYLDFLHRETLAAARAR